MSWSSCCFSLFLNNNKCLETSVQRISRGLTMNDKNCWNIPNYITFSILEQIAMQRSPHITTMGLHLETSVLTPCCTTAHGIKPNKSFSKNRKAESMSTGLNESLISIITYM